MTHNPPRFGFVGQIRAGANITLTQDALGYTIAGDAGGGGGGGALVYSNTTVPAGNTIANTAAETAFTSSYDIPADTLVEGDVIRIKLYGVYGTDALLAPTIRGKVKLDSTIMLDTGAVTSIVGVTNGGWWADAVFVVQTIGATGTIEAQGFVEFATAATTGLSVNAENTAAITIDTTVDQTITVTVQWGTADTDNTITLREMTVYHDALVGVLSRGYASGTAFPSAPATNDVFFRTDRSLLYFWNGTRWLTVQQYTIPLTAHAALPTARSATTATLLAATPALGQTYDFWMESFCVSHQVNTTNDGARFWTFALLKYDNSTPTTIVSPNTSALAATTVYVANTAIGALLGTSYEILVMDLNKTSTPGTCNVFGAMVIGRLVG